MTKAIGPGFATELKAAGLLGQHFSWQPDGTLEFFADTPPAIVAAVQAVYAAHDPAAAAPPPRQLAPLDFMALFTEAELEAIVAATIQTAAIKLWYDRMLAARYIDLDDPLTSAGLDALVAAGLLTAARTASVLSGMAS
jgi:hypothetical protein